MNKDLEDYVASCEVCNSQPAAQGKEPLICHQIPSRPWEKIAVDLFELNGREFMVTVDYYSSFFEVPVQNADADKPQAGLPGLSQSTEPVIHPTTTTTRSGRAVRPPTRFMDYQP